ncbi:hypothetical protein [Streptomyces sp. XD-27]|uniref:hypothetical protein n=1 Tax=Streptomyces sp. XD-27 TaxID=3062779 RepID=UPI0026F47C2A|nr:hypothetical protein [Streptomyces sp. XD-27]WKX71547.1 hypothetical protein Q3Y56_17970 [Streptomyces sp. XD-27]
MNSAPHLLIEDRPEFERILDEALRTAHRGPDSTAAGRRLTNEQLRTMALNASAAISACAAAEYEHFVALRDELRDPAHRPAVAPPAVAEGGGAGADDDGTGPGDPADRTTVPNPSGAGLVAVLTVLAPLLAGTAAAIFLLLGYALRMLHPALSIAQPMVTAGWFFAVLTAAGLLIAAIGLLLTALRNGGATPRGAASRTRAEEVDRAREAWRQALLERGVLPFLYEAMAAAPPPAETPARSYSPGHHPQPAGRTPHLGYSRPGFSTEDGDTPTTRPRFSSPDFSSPDYGGPDHHPE